MLTLGLTPLRNRHHRNDLGSTSPHLHDVIGDEPHHDLGLTE
jgi:hypothetical protein